MNALFIIELKHCALIIRSRHCTLYHQTNIQSGFWCSHGLNFKSLIQLSKSLPVELTKT